MTKESRAIIIRKSPKIIDSPHDETSLPEPLSKADLVIVKDSWNKFLPLDAMLIEMFVERLLIAEPALVEQFGPALEQVPAEFMRLFDLTVRALDAATEETLREAYPVAPAARVARSRSVADCGAFFAAYGMTADQWRSARDAFVWVFGKAPYMEDYESDDLKRGPHSALGRFFSRHVAAPMIAHARAEEAALSPEIAAEMRAGAEKLLAHPQEAGISFYRTLFQAHPEVLRHFRTADLDALSRHLIDAVVFLSRATERLGDLRQELSHLTAVHHGNQIPSAEYALLAGPLLDTLSRYGTPLTDRTAQGWRVLFNRVIRIIAAPMVRQERLTAAAREFIDQLTAELSWPPHKVEKRWSEITHEIHATGSYTQTFEELEYGAKLAWRNAPKCIGRISWKNLIVRDRRHVTDPDAMFRECVEHLRAATNGGNVEIVLTAFRPTRPGERWGPRIWNAQLIRYAGYLQPDGSVIGDRANVALTDAVRALGWQPPAGPSHFDVLPLVIEVPGAAPRLYEWDKPEILEVPISHPTIPAIAELGLKWCAVPAITNFRMEIGGIDYGCLPFNGWFMGTEIARNLFEDKRYDRAEAIAEALGLDTSSESTLWRDRAFLELNVAILHAFQEARVTLVDHQTASRQFMIHDLREKKAGRECPAQWSWIAPAAGGSTTPVWHHEMRDFHLRPCYSYGADRWAVAERAPGCPHAAPSAMPESERVLILYASETGTAESYARQAGRRLGALAPRVLAMDEIAPEELRHERKVLLIASTCRDGEMPAAGEAMLAWLAGRAPGELHDTGFAVLGIGNRIYPHFCAAAVKLDAALAAAGAERLSALELADEIAGQSDTVKRWLELFAKRWVTSGQPSKSRRALVEVAAAGRSTAPEGARYATVVANAEMLGPAAAADRSTRHLTLQIDPPDDAFQCGDHLAVYPQNPQALVERVSAHLGLTADAWFHIRGSDTPALARYRDAYPLRQLLAEDLDLAMPEAPEELLMAMRAVSRDPDDQSQLDRWIGVLELEESNPARQSLRASLRDSYITLADLLDAFPHSVPDLPVLVELLPRLKPRLYSIANSPAVHAGEAHLMVGVLKVTLGDGRERRGICSHYLRDRVAGDRVRVALKPAARRLPASFDGPLLMVAAGTGLAPLYGAVQDRAARGTKASADRPAALYFGCRNAGEFLKGAELKAWRAQGHLTRLTVAFSRQGPVKSYVQDALAADGGTVWDVLRRPGCRFVICGDAKMAQDVEEQILVILQREGGRTYAEAVRFLQTLRREGRYIEDVWGLQLNREVMLPEMIRSRYDRGTGWLARLQRAFAGRAPQAGAIVEY